MVKIYIGSLKEKELASKAEKIYGENLHRQLNKKRTTLNITSVAKKENKLN